MPMRRAVLVLLSALVAAPLAAQPPPPVPSSGGGAGGDAMPPRPRLDSAAADSNEARSYVVEGRRLMRRDPAAAARAFHWASRLDPTLAAPYALRWEALWRSNRRLMEKYERGDRKVVETGEGQRIDSLYLRALQRDPCSPLDAEVRGADTQPLAFIRLVVARRPGSVELRVILACSLYLNGQNDSALSQIDQARALLERREAESQRPVYQSKAMFHYFAGKVLATSGDMNAAREAFGRALAEDLAFHPAHAAIAAIAWTNWSDTAAAVQEYELALQLDPADGVLHYNYGTVLLQAGRAAEAVEQLERAVALEPYFANAHFNLALALERTGRPADARVHYKIFVERAPQSMREQIETAKSKD